MKTDHYIIYFFRYILDGDRNELRNIRDELSALKTNSLKKGNVFNRNNNNEIPSYTSNMSLPKTIVNENISINEMQKNEEILKRLVEQKAELLNTGLYKEGIDPIIDEINYGIDNIKIVIAKNENNLLYSEMD